MPHPTPCPRRWLARFALVWGGQRFSLIGSALAQFALVWWLTQTTGSATVPAIVRLEDGRTGRPAVVTEV